MYRRLLKGKSLSLASEVGIFGAVRDLDALWWFFRDEASRSRTDLARGRTGLVSHSQSGVVGRLST